MTTPENDWNKEKIFLRKKFDITQENSRFKIWLSDFYQKIEFLLFKFYKFISEHLQKSTVKITNKSKYSKTKKKHVQMFTF